MVVEAEEAVEAKVDQDMGVNTHLAMRPDLGDRELFQVDAVESGTELLIEPDEFALPQPVDQLSHRRRIVRRHAHVREVIGCETQEGVAQ
jgi:hypothetical protein